MLDLLEPVLGRGFSQEAAQCCFGRPLVGSDEVPGACRSAMQVTVLDVALVLLRGTS